MHVKEHRTEAWLARSCACACAFCRQHTPVMSAATRSGGRKQQQHEQRRIAAGVPAVPATTHAAVAACTAEGVSTEGGRRGQKSFVHTWRTSLAPIFSTGSSSSTSFATVTPSFTILGDPYLLSSTTLRPCRFIRGDEHSRTTLQGAGCVCQDAAAAFLWCHEVLQQSPE